MRLSNGPPILPLRRRAALVFYSVKCSLHCPTPSDRLKSRDTRWRQELQTLLAHGILHLVGHDHEEPGDAAAMEQATREIMEQTAQSSAPVS